MARRHRRNHAKNQKTYRPPHDHGVSGVGGSCGMGTYHNAAHMSASHPQRSHANYVPGVGVNHPQNTGSSRPLPASASTVEYGYTTPPGAMMVTSGNALQPGIPTEMPLGYGNPEMMRRVAQRGGISGKTFRNPHKVTRRPKNGTTRTSRHAMMMGRYR